VSGEYLPEDSTIILYFTSHTITLKGTKLDTLFVQLIEQKPKTINAEYERFEEISDQQYYFVNSIEIERK